MNCYQKNELHPFLCSTCYLCCSSIAEMFNCTEKLAIERFWHVAELQFRHDRSLPQYFGLENDNVLLEVLHNCAGRLRTYHPRYLEAFRPLCTDEHPNLIVLSMDGSRHKNAKCKDHFLQKLYHNSYYGRNVATKLEGKYILTL